MERSGLQELEKTLGALVPWSLGRNAALPTPWFQPRELRFRLLTSRAAERW